MPERSGRAGPGHRLSATAAAGAGNNVFVLSGTSFASKAEVEDALETGGAFAMTGLHADVAANDAFIAVWTDGTNAYVTAMHHTTETADDGDFETGNLTSFNLAIVTGVTTIGSTTFAAGNFEWIT